MQTTLTICTCFRMVSELYNLSSACNEIIPVCSTDHDQTQFTYRSWSSVTRHNRVRYPDTNQCVVIFLTYYILVVEALKFI